MFFKTTKSILIIFIISFSFILCGCSNNKKEESIITEGASDNVIDPYLSKIVYLPFESCIELKEYIDSNNKITKSFYFINLDSFFIHQDFHKIISYTCSSEDNYNNSYIEISASIYDSKLGYDNSYDNKSNLDVLNESYRILLKSFPFDYDGGEFNLKHYKYNDGKTIFNNVLYVYYKGNVISKLFYYRTNEIKIDYFIELFDTNKIFIKNV